MRQDGAMTVVIQPSPLTYGNRQRIIDLAMNYRLGTIFAFPVAAREGALVGYGPDYVHMYRKVPFYVEHVLKGMKPADLPIERPNKVELVVNLVWGVFCQGGSARVLSIFIVGFLVRSESPVSSSRPRDGQVADARRSGQGWPLWRPPEAWP